MNVGLLLKIGRYNCSTPFPTMAELRWFNVWQLSPGVVRPPLPRKLYVCNLGEIAIIKKVQESLDIPPEPKRGCPALDYKLRHTSTPTAVLISRQILGKVCGECKVEP